MSARSASASSTKARSRKKMTNHTVIRALYACSADTTDNSFSYTCPVILFGVATPVVKVMDSLVESRDGFYTGSDVTIEYLKND